MLSFVFAAVTCAFVCLAYSELASFLPVSGSSYTYAYASLGEIFGWWVGWSLILEYSVGASAVAGGWSAYFVGILHSMGIDLPKALTAVPADGGIINLPAVLIVALATALLVVGVRESARVNRVLVYVKIGTIFLFLFLAGPHIEPMNWEPFLPYGIHGVFAGTAVLFFAYLGFDALSTAAEETKNPKRDMPIGIISALAICTVLYIAVCAAMTGVVPYPMLDTAAPASFVLEYIGLHLGSAIVGTGAICGLSTVVLGMLFAQSRALYSMSRDGLMPMSLYKVHPSSRRRTSSRSSSVSSSPASRASRRSISSLKRAAPARSSPSCAPASASWFCAASIRIIARIPLPGCPHHRTVGFHLLRLHLL